MVMLQSMSSFFCLSKADGPVKQFQRIYEYPQKKLRVLLLTRTYGLRKSKEKKFLQMNEAKSIKPLKISRRFHFV